VVAWNITGEPDTTATIEVDHNRRGQFTKGTGEPDAVLTLTMESLQLLMCGRRPYASVAVDVHGDADLGERVISALVVTP
jgi:hypothetical protein